MVLTFTERVGSSIFGSARQNAADTAGQAYKAIVSRYELYERYYENSQYETVNAVTQVLKSTTGLYRNIRSIHNPLRRAVDWYPGHVYPGVMTSDGMPLPDGTPCCVPFALDTDETLRLALIQPLLWGNWGSNRYAVIRDLAVLGDVFAEIEVDYERAKVYQTFTHPKYVIDVEWNGSGDIIAYWLEIPKFDEDTKRSYRYGKFVDRERIVTFYDDRPHSYVEGQPAEIDNPWGFVPAAWAQFRNVGGQHGASLIDGVRGKIDQLNSSVASIHDFIGKFVAQGILITGTNRKDFEAANTAATAAGATAERYNPEGGRQEVRYIFAPKDTDTTKLIENLGLAESDPHIARLIAEIEADLPEPTIDDRIQQMSTPPSGRALKLMFGGPAGRLDEVSGNADHLLIKLMQMGVSIGGELANSGAWGLRSQMSEAQQRFLPFSLRSWADGSLANVTLMPRPLFPDSPQDRIQTAIQMEALKTVTGRRLAGMGEDDNAALAAELERNQVNASAFLGQAFSSGAA